MAFRRDQLRYFVAVAEEGQMTRAASKLHIAQPALSQAIAHLEEHVGFKLFERHARGVSLTPAAEIFLEKARLAVAAEEMVAQAADALVRAAHVAIKFGYLGLPPAMTNPDLIEAFTEAHPDVELDLQELPFPSLPTETWLAEVDVAIASRPTSGQHVWTLPLSAVPRVILAPTTHPLAGHSELAVADVLDETFIGFHESVDPAWAGFWSLDDHRGGPPPSVTLERSANAQERFAMIASGHAITAMPERHAAVIAKVLPTVVAIPLIDADPTVLTLIGREDRRNPSVDALLEVARQTASFPAATPNATVDPLHPQH
jgi:DNA-binding transcriptional LysR family regulator